MSGRSLEDTVVGDYLIRDFIASGGMGEVYHAWHLNKQTPAAIKILQMDATRDPRMKERFSREVNALKRLWHSHIVRLYEFGELSDGRMYMIMEYVDGGTLYDEWTNYYEQGEYMPTDRVVYTMHKVSVAMAHAHEQGVIHRDLKPSNILVRANGEPVVTDLGIAALAGVNPMTGTLDSMGTPIYMAPEQLTTGGYTDERVDIYALGVMMYELLTGRRPYEAENNWSLINAKLNYDPVPLYEYRPDIPWHIRQVVSRCLQLDPEYRHASAELLAEDLRTILAGKTPPPALITRREPPPAPQFIPHEPEPEREPEPDNRFHYPPIPRPGDELEAVQEAYEYEPDQTAIDPADLLENEIEDKDKDNNETALIKKARPQRVQVQAQYRPREIRPAVDSVEPPPPLSIATPLPAPPDLVPPSRREPTNPVVLERTIIEQNDPPHDPRLDLDPPPYRPTERPIREPGVFEAFILRLLNGVSSPEPMGAKLLVPLAIGALALILLVGFGAFTLLRPNSVEPTIPAGAVTNVADVAGALEEDTGAFVPVDESDDGINDETETPTPIPMDTPLPADINTPQFTVTPRPTTTPAPTVSDTPDPESPEPSRTPRPTRTSRPTFTPTFTSTAEPTSMIAVTVPTDVEEESIEAVIVSETATAEIEDENEAENESESEDENEESIEGTETVDPEETRTPLSISTITPTVAVDSSATATTLAQYAEATEEAEATATREAAEQAFAVGATATARHYNQVATQTREALAQEWRITETARAVPPDPLVINRAGRCINAPFGGQVDGMTWTWRGTLKAGQSFSIVVGAPNSSPSNVRQTGITTGWGGTNNNGAWEASPFNHQLVRGNYSWTVWLVQNGETLMRAQNSGCLNVN